MHKLRTEAEMLREREALRVAGKRVGFTNGCFDLLHVGHVRYLRDARAMVDALIVGLNTDDSVRLLKGEGRPLMPELERAEVLAALEAVDYVILFSDRTAERLVDTLKPDVYLKGGDYSVGALPEARVVGGYGGDVVLLPLHPGRASTALLEKLKRL